MAASTLEEAATYQESKARTNGTSPSPSGIPPLVAGDFLTRSEFERRYHNHPEIKKAELIEGIVYMPSPVNARYHGNPHFDLIAWLGFYRANVPGLTGSDNATLRLDNFNEPQPDALLRFDVAQGGRSQIGEDGYLEGAVELVLEVAASCASYDMNQKKSVYARHGILEYLVILTHEKRVVWYILRDGSYEEIQADEQGILRSETLPGLWLQKDAVWENDLSTMLATLQEGLASPEHAAFLQSLSTS